MKRRLAGARGPAARTGWMSTSIGSRLGQPATPDWPRLAESDRGRARVARPSRVPRRPASTGPAVRAGRAVTARPAATACARPSPARERGCAPGGASGSASAPSSWRASAGHRRPQRRRPRTGSRQSGGAARTGQPGVMLARGSRRPTRQALGGEGGAQPVHVRAEAHQRRPGRPAGCSAARRRSRRSGSVATTPDQGPRTAPSTARSRRRPATGAPTARRRRSVAAVAQAGRPRLGGAEREQVLGGVADQRRRRPAAPAPAQAR